MGNMGNIREKHRKRGFRGCLAVGVLAVLLLFVAGCSQSGIRTVEPVLYDYESEPAGDAAAQQSQQTGASASEPAAEVDISETVDLNLSVFYNDSVRMTYSGTDDGASGKPQAEYVAANGKTYRTGDWKPVWEEIQSRLNINIHDVVPEEAGSISEAWSILEEQGFQGVDVMVAPSSKVTAAGMEGTFLDLSEYMDSLPSFSAFLSENPVVETSITAPDGGIYYTPYFDGYDDIERMLILRADWVQTLLDDDSAVYDTGREVETYCQPYMPESLDTYLTASNAFGTSLQTIHVQYEKNILSIQNDLEVKNGETLTRALKDYIDAAYGDQYTKRSNLFIGADAAYNADELIALMRCVLANPLLLSGQDAYDLVPFFPRSADSNRVQQVFSLAEIWGVRGLESRNGWFYVDEDGQLQDGRFDSAMMDALERLHDMYQEGLILQDFYLDDATAELEGSDHRDRLLTANLGFATYDYNQTTTAYNSLASGIDGFALLPVLPPVADWSGDGTYTRFTASWRSVKTDCWAILASVAEDEAKLERCLQLFDYMYSDEGHTLMSFGPEDWIDGTIYYNGQYVPKLSDAALTELETLADGNYTNYYRMWLGATMPIGYIKDQGMEYQTLDENGQTGLGNILTACRLGAMEHLSTARTSEAVNTMVPTTITLSEEESAEIAEKCSGLTDAFTIGDDGKNIFIEYIVEGFGGSGEDGTVLLDRDGLRSWLYTELGGESYLQDYRSAYQRMQQAD